MAATTEKVSVSIGAAELRLARAVARQTGVSLSMLFTDAVRELVAQHRRREAALEILATFAPEERASPKEMKALLARWSRPRRPKGRRTGRRAA
jgi:hypothetical protein